MPAPTHPVLAAREPPVEATIARPCALAGRGLHTGRRSHVRLLPAPAGNGIRFRRVDASESGVEVRADLDRCVERPLCTALMAEDGRTLVRTVQHLMAALSALAIDNLLVEIVGEELPIFDGSAIPWCEALAACGRQDQAVRRSRLEVRRRIEVRKGRQLAILEPISHPALRLGVRIELKGFGVLLWRGDVTPESFRDELAPSRSFGRLKWVLPLQIYARLTGRMILRGGTLGSAAPLWGGGIVGGARVAGEPVRHRALDFIGDMALLGSPLVADVTLENPGHVFNHLVAHEVRRRLADGGVALV